MSLLDLFREPAPIRDEFVRRVQRLGDWPPPGKGRSVEDMRAMRLRQVVAPSPELLAAIRSGMSRGEAMRRFGITSSTFYRLRERVGIRELTDEELSNVGGY